MSEGKERGTIANVGLTIRPQSDNVLIGQITEASLSDLDEQDADYDSAPSDVIDSKTVLQGVPLNKLFKIHLRNGVIDTLSVDQTMTMKQINQVKFIASQFQVDTKAQNLVRESGNYQQSDRNTNNYYTTMEPTVFGVCKTIYDISHLPEYLAYAKYDTIPSLSKYAGEDEVIEIVKNTNYKDCNNEQAGYNADIIDRKQDSNSLSANIIVTGSLDKYTIHSSVATNINGDMKDYIYLTLESMERSNADSSYNNSPQFGSMQNVGNLVYKMDRERY